MDLKGSKTEQNLMTAFSAETQAKCKYDQFERKIYKNKTKIRKKGIVPPYPQKLII